PLDTVALVDRIADLATEDAGGSGRSALEVRFLTDLQRSAFIAPTPAAAPVPAPKAQPPGQAAPASAPGLQEGLERLHTLGAQVSAEALGSPTPLPANIGIESVEAPEGVLGAGLPCEIAVAVRNFGGAGRSGVRVALSVDGERQPSQKVDVGS